MIDAVYYETTSLLHRLNPLTKLTGMVPLIVFMTMTNGFWTPLCFILLTTLMVLIGGRIPLGRFTRIAFPMLIFIGLFCLTYPFFIRHELVAHSPVVLQLGPLIVYQEGITLSIAMALRIYALLMLSLPFTLTTDASAFIRALVQQWHLPYKVGYGTLAAFRFMPMLQSEMQIIQSAHRIRGVHEKTGLSAAFFRLRRYTIPLLVTALRRAERTAMAMDGRAFGAFPTRTYYKLMRFQALDFWYLALFWGLCLVLIAGLWFAGLLGPLGIPVA